MPKRPPGKGRGAEVFLGGGDKPPVKKRRAPKGQGAEVFLGREGGPARKRPPLAPATVSVALDQVCQTVKPSHGSLDRSHLLVALWLRIALKEAGL